MDWKKAKDEDILHKVLEDFKNADTARKPNETKWLRYYKLYRSYATNPKAYGANLFIPYAFSIVESVLPRLLSSMFASRPYIGVLALGKDKVDNAKVHERLMDYQLVQRIHILLVFTSWVKEALMYGTGIIKTGWRYETKVIPQPVVTDSIMEIPLKTEIQDQDTVIYDDPTVEHIDLWDFYIDPSATTVDNAEFGIHKFFRDIEYLRDKEEEGIYSNIDKVAEGQKSRKEKGANERFSAIGLGTDDASTTNDVEIIEYWTDDWVIAIADRSVVIRNEANPYHHRKKPFVRLIDILVPHEFYGIGEIEPIEYLQYELNDTRNMRMDNVNLVINHMWKMLRGADIKPDELVSRAGGVVQVDDMSDIEPLEVKDVTNVGLQAEESIKRDMDNSVGVYDYARGETTDRRETATTASILSQAANERFKLKVMLMEDMGLRRLGELIIQLNQQYIDRERVIRILGDDGVDFPTVTPEELAGQFDAMPIGSVIEPVANKEARLNQLISLYGIIKDSPYINQPELLKKILEAADIKDTQRVLQEVLPQEGMMGQGMPQGMGPGMMGGDPAYGELGDLEAEMEAMMAEQFGE